MFFAKCPYYNVLRAFFRNPGRILLLFLFIGLFSPARVRAQTFNQHGTGLYGVPSVRIADWGANGYVALTEQEISRLSSDMNREGQIFSINLGTQAVKYLDASALSGQQMGLLALDSASHPVLFALDTSDAIIWSIALDSTLSPQRMVTTHDSGLAITGQNASNNPFLLKINSSGAVVFAREYTATGWNSSIFIQNTPDDGFILGSYGVMVKTDSLGNVQWNTTGNFNEFVVSETGSIFCRDVVSIGANSGAAVLKFNQQGQFLAARMIDIGDGSGVATSIGVARNGDVFVSGDDQFHKSGGLFDRSAGVYNLDSALNFYGYSEIDNVVGGRWLDAVSKGGSYVMGVGHEQGPGTGELTYTLLSRAGFCFGGYAIATNKTVVPFSITTGNTGTITTNNFSPSTTPVSLQFSAPPFYYNTSSSVWGFCQCTPGQADFSSQTSGNTVKFSVGASDFSELVWDFGDGSTSTELFPTHTFASSGGQYVCLAVKNDFCGGWDTLCKWVPAGCSAPTAQFSVNTSQPIIQFTDQSTSASTLQSWLWDFGDGSTSSLQNPGHVYAVRDTYTVCLTVTDTCVPTTICQQVIANCQALNAGFTQSATGFQVNFSNLSTGQLNNFWDFGDGNSSSAANPTHTYSGPGNYTACLVISDSCGADTFCSPVQFSPIAGFGAQLSGSGLSLQFSPDPGPADSIIWDFGDGNSINALSPAHTFNNPGNYLVNQSVYAGGSVDTFSNWVSVADTSLVQSALWKLPRNGGGWLVHSSQLADGNFLYGGFSTVMKTDPLGNRIWEKSYAPLELYQGMIPTLDGGFATATDETDGLFQAQMFLRKYDTQGNPEWSAYYGSSGDEFTHGLTQLADSGYVIYGYESGNAVLVRTDPNGNLLFDRNFSLPNGVLSVRDVQQAQNGDLFAMMRNSGSQGFAQYLMRIDLSGNVLWTHGYGLNPPGDFAPMALMPDGGVVFPTLENSQFRLVRVDSAGNVRWATTATGIDLLYHEISGITQTSEGLLAVSGTDLGTFRPFTLLFDENGTFLSGNRYDNSYLFRRMFLGEADQWGRLSLMVDMSFGLNDSIMYGFSHGLGGLNCAGTPILSSPLQATIGNAAASLTQNSGLTGNTTPDFVVSTSRRDWQPFCQGTHSPGPAASFSFSVSPTGDQISFTNTTPSTSPEAMLWDFGDGTSGSGPNPVHTYANGGTYTVCLTVFTAGGSQSNCQQVCTIKPRFFTQINGSNVDFVSASTGTGPFSYDWKFGDGASSSLANPTHSYAQSGTYYVCLIISNSCVSGTLCKAIAVDTASLDSRFAIRIDPDVSPPLSNRLRQANNDGTWIIQDDGQVMLVDRLGNLSNGFLPPAGDLVNDLAPTLDGGVILIGTTTQTGGNGKDIFVTRLNSNMQTIWSNRYGQAGGDEEVGLRIYAYPDSSYILLGANESNGRAQGIKLDKNGGVVWQKFAVKGTLEILDAAPTQDNGMVFLARNNLNHMILYKWNLVGTGVLKRRSTNAGVTAFDRISAASDGGFYLSSSSTPYVAKTDPSLFMVWQSELAAGFQVAEVRDGLNGNAVVMGSAGLPPNSRYILISLNNSGLVQGAHAYEQAELLTANSLVSTDNKGFVMGGIKTGTDGTNTNWLVRTDSLFQDSCTRQNFSFPAGNATSFTIASTSISNGNTSVSSTPFNWGGTPIPAIEEAECRNFCPQGYAAFTDSTDSLTLFLTDQSSGSPSTWHWDFGDGNTSSLQNPNHVYAGFGSYTVCLAITDSCGTDTVCRSITLQSCFPDTLPITYSGPSMPGICDTITLQGPAGMSNYSWNTGASSPNIQVSQQGTYVLTYVDTSSCAQQDTFLYEPALQPLNWVLPTGAAQSGDTLFRTVPGKSSWGTSGAISFEFLPANTDGRLRHILHSKKFIYFLGWSDSPSDGVQGQIDHAFSINRAKVSVREESGTDISLGNLNVGDTLELSRTGSTLNWLVNGAVVHSTSVNPGTGLFADVSLRKRNMYLTNVAVDYCGGALMDLSTEISHDICANSPSGAIELSIFGGLPPYTFSWSTGASSQNVSNLPGGTYSVTVSDQIGQLAQAQYEVLNRISWVAPVGAVSTVDTLQRTLSGSGWGTSGARSREVLPGGQSGGFRHVVGSIGDNYFIGLSETDSNSSQNSIDFALGNLKGDLRILESGGFSGNFGTVVLGDTLEIRRDGGQVSYFLNGSLLRTTSTNSSKYLFVKAALASQNMILKDVFSDFCQATTPLQVTANWSHQNCFSSNGSIDLSLLNGLPPYSFTWSNGASSEDLSNLSSGNYSVTITDAAGNTLNSTYEILNKVNWEGFTGATAQGDTLIRTVPGSSSWGTSGARSDNKLLGGIDGSLLHIVDRLDKFYYIGLSSSDPDASQLTIDHAFYNAKGKLILREEAGNFSQVAGLLNIGDSLRIDRVGTNISYALNGVVLRTVGVNAGDTLRADASLYSQGTELTQVYLSFCDTVVGMKFSGNSAGEAHVPEGEIRLLPNPARERLSFTADLSGDWFISITDLTGKVLETRKFNGNTQELDVSAYSAGIYFLKIRESVNGRLIWRKWVKQ